MNKTARKPKEIREGKAKEGHPSLAQPPPGPSEESEPNWMIEEDAEMVLLALFGGKPWGCTPFEEIAEDCPLVWHHALEVFGNRAAARKWLETPLAAFKYKCPYVVALQVGGERKVLRALQKLTQPPG